MTSKAAAVRQWIARARVIHDRLESYEQAALTLGGACGCEKLVEERNDLRAKEAVARMELYDALQSVTLSPRQFTVIHLHYLQYESWSEISENLQIERRYALQIHTQAIERLAGQIYIGKSSPEPASGSALKI